MFNWDVAMFHSWMRSFKAMVKDADMAADQELNYLRSYTSVDPQQLVDNYRKRQGDNPTVGSRRTLDRIRKVFWQR